MRVRGARLARDLRSMRLASLEGSKSIPTKRLRADGSCDVQRCRQCMRDHLARDYVLRTARVALLVDRGRLAGICISELRSW